MFSNYKSREPDFYLLPIKTSLKRIENEQVHQRLDLSVINALLKSLMADIGVQKQVDDYFDKDDHEHETSPQTDTDEQS